MYDCPHCSKNIITERAFQRHLANCKKKLYSCELCDSKFDKLTLLETHMKEVHWNTGKQGDRIIKMEEDKCDTIETKIKLEESHSSVQNYQMLDTIAGNGQICVRIHNVGDDSLNVPYSGNIPIKMEPSAEETALDKHNGEPTLFSGAFKQGTESDVNTSSNETIIATTVQIKNEPVDIDDVVSCKNVEAGDNQQYQQNATSDALPSAVVNMPKVVKTTKNPASKTAAKLMEAPKLKTKCPHCCRHFFIGVVYAKHILHCGPRNCEICNLKFAKYHQYTYHVKQYHKELRLVCPHCPKGFIEQSDFTKHTEDCATRRFRCEICALKFKRNTDLVSHKSAMHKTDNAKSADLSAKETVASGGGKILLEDDRINIKTEITLEETTLQAQDIELEDPVTIKEGPNRQFPCPICKKVYSSQSGMQYHKRTHTVPRFKCPECSKWFHVKSKLIRHMEAHNRKKRKKELVVQTVDESQQCSICELTFPNKIKLRSHIMYNHEQPRFKCNRCPKLFYVRKRLLHHSEAHDREYEKEMRRVSKADPKDIKECKICNIPFANRQRLRHHVVTTHEEPRFKCSKCDKLCYYRTDLNRHELVHLKNELGYLPSPEQLLKAKIAIEPPPLPSCEHCNIQFPNKRIRHHHMVVVHTEPKFKCPFCPKMCHFQYLLEKHKRTHREMGADKMCRTCGVKFETAVMKWRHMLKVHQISRYYCPECSEPFMYKQRMRRHMRIRHKKELPARVSVGAYSMLTKNCSECNLQFATIVEKRKHMLENHAELLTRCSQCPKAFARKLTLQRHEQLAHGALQVRQANALIGSSPSDVNPSHDRKVCKRERTPWTRTCSKCGVMFSTKSEKNKHMVQDHAESLFKRSRCPIYKNKLKKLRNTPHDTEQKKSETKPMEPVKPVGTTPCSICGLQLDTRTRKRHHMLMAHSEPKFKCSFCTKLFYYKQSLDRHETSHRRKQKARSTGMSKNEHHKIEDGHADELQFEFEAVGIKIENSKIDERCANITYDNKTYKNKQDDAETNKSKTDQYEVDENKSIKIKTEESESNYVIIPTQTQVIKQELLDH